MEQERKRTYEWKNPLESAQQAITLSGFEYLKAIHEGKIAHPPVMDTVDFEIKDIEKGNVTFRFIPQEFHYNPIGSIHGGIISTILDSAIGCTLHSVLPKGKAYTTLELKVNFLRKIVRDTGEMQTIGKIIHTGKSTALVEASLLDSTEKVYAHAVSTCMIFDL